MAEENEKEPSEKAEPADEKPSKKKKERKLGEKDWKKVEALLKTEYGKRKTSQFRQNHEKKWKMVDRQVNLEPAEVESSNPEEDWLNVFELGDLAQASEIMTADILRVVFPESRSWFEVHVEPPMTDLDVSTGDKAPLDKKVQNQLDGRLRSLMTQQHVTFGLRDRVELSIKEALHHGGFVAEVSEEYLDMYFNGTSVKELCAPAWVPHSMWNCFPDPSPSLVGSSMFYTGSMFIRRYMPRHLLFEMATGDGWIKNALKKVPKEEHTVRDEQIKDVELVYYWGDVIIPASGDTTVSSSDDLFYPNYKAILANGKLVYLDANPTPYPPIVYKSYEKMDVRDPYGMSPIIKQSPMQSITTIMANEFVNSSQLHARPPIVYDGNDPDFVINGGPIISPGAKTSSKGTSNFHEMKIGDPRSALAGVQFGKQTMKESLGRPGIDVGARATKAEVDTKQADSEAGPFGFAIKLDDALRTFLYMQHAMNLSKPDFKFSYYNPELDSPDFLRATREDLPDTVHFEVVGSKGVLGEARRHQAFAATTVAISGNPLFAPLLEPVEIVKQMYMDAGIKGPERFLKQSDGLPPQVKIQIEKMQQLVQQLQGELETNRSELQVKLQKATWDHETKLAKIQSGHESDLADQKIKMAELQSKHHIATNEQAHAEKVAHLERIIREFEHVVEKTVLKHGGSKPETPPSDGMMGLDIPTIHPDNQYVLHRDAQGNHAYIGPNGEIQELDVNAV